MDAVLVKVTWGYRYIRVTHVNAKSQIDLPNAVIVHRHQREKERSNNQRCMELELSAEVGNDSFTVTPLVFSTNGVWEVSPQCTMSLATRR